LLYGKGADSARLTAQLRFDVTLTAADPGQGSYLHRQESEQIIDGYDTDQATSGIYDGQPPNAFVAHHINAPRDAVAFPAHRELAP
jgi:hypothetical protein